MPNHCGNRLTVTGDFKDRQEFVDGVREKPESEEVKIEDLKPLDFNRIIPEPPNVDKWVDTSVPRHPIQLFLGMNGGCIAWRNKHWGTKWGAYEVVLEHNEEKTVFTFQTAWAPPNENLMKAMAAKFPKVKLDLRYAERGVEFYGYWTPEKSECWKFQNDDVQPIYESDDETDEDEREPCDYKLRPGLALYADLYAMSG